MASAPFYPKWTPADGDSIAQLTAITGAPGNLWPYPASALPAGVASGMPNIRDCYISGYLKPENISGDIQPIGELLVTRAHDVPESGKAYMYLIAIDDTCKPHLTGPFKPYDAHYYDSAAGVPVEKLFGRIDRTDLAKKIL